MHPLKTQHSSARAGFTLIEAMGVVMVMALLAMALVPSLIRQLDRQARAKEAATLERLADGLAQHITRSFEIPHPTNFAARIATLVGLRLEDVTRNERGLQRVFLLEPAVTAQLPIPYTQSRLGVANNLSTRWGVLIVSSVGNPLPTNLVSGMASSQGLFTNLWNASEGTIPSGLAWTGDPSDLRIQRVNLATLFVPLVLNYDAYSLELGKLGEYKINDSAITNLPSVPVFAANFIKGTVLGLHDASQGGVTGGMQACDVLQHPMSYIFQNDVWRGSMFVTPTPALPTSPEDLQAALELFVNSALNASSQGNPQTTNQNVVDAMVEFMTNYVAWATNHSAASLSNLVSSQHALDDTTEDILHRPGVPDVEEDEDQDGYGDSGGNAHENCTQHDHNEGHCTGRNNGGAGTCSNGGHHDHDGNCSGGNSGGNCNSGSNNNGSNNNGSNGNGNSGNGNSGNGNSGNGNSGNGNNGHGNNADGVDSSNPGNGNGGPTGTNNSGNDPSGGVDDENNSSGGSGSSCKTKKLRR